MRLMENTKKEEQALVGAQEDLPRQPRLAGRLILKVELRDPAELVVNVRYVVRKVLACANSLLRLWRAWCI